MIFPRKKLRRTFLSAIFIPGQQFQVEWQHADDTSSEITLGIPDTFDPMGNPIWVDSDGQVLILHDGRPEILFPPHNDHFSFVAAVWTPHVWLTDGAATEVEQVIQP
jgi:hypothetical protein